MHNNHKHRLLAVVIFAAAFGGMELAATEKDPLAKFSDENLADIGFCFDTFCSAVSTGDAKTAAALIAELPKTLVSLDLNKEADRATFLRALARYQGATLVKAQKMHGMGEVTYTDKSGKEQTQRMQLAGGRWKLVEP